MFMSFDEFNQKCKIECDSFAELILKSSEKLKRLNKPFGKCEIYTESMVLVMHSLFIERQPDCYDNPIKKFNNGFYDGFVLDLTDCEPNEIEKIDRILFSQKFNVCFDLCKSYYTISCVNEHELKKNVAKIIVRMKKSCGNCVIYDSEWNEIGKCLFYNGKPSRHTPIVYGLFNDGFYGDIILEKNVFKYNNNINDQNEVNKFDWNELSKNLSVEEKEWVESFITELVDGFRNEVN